MTVLTPPRLQRGAWAHHTQSWATVPTVNMDTTQHLEAWVQWDIASARDVIINPVTNLMGIDAAHIGSTFTFDLLVYGAPLFADFSNTNPPTTLVRRQLAFLTIQITAASFTVTPPLHTAQGQATALCGELHAERALDVNSRHRFAMGVRLSASSPTAVANNVSLDLLTLTTASNITGDTRNVAPAGSDRQVLCPRCGVLALESSLRKDGVIQGLEVCSECYDPPTPPPNWSFPFRS